MLVSEAPTSASGAGTRFLPKAAPLRLEPAPLRPHCPPASVSAETEESSYAATPWPDVSSNDGMGALPSISGLGGLSDGLSGAGDNIVDVDGLSLSGHASGGAPTERQLPQTRLVACRRDAPADSSQQHHHHDGGAASAGTGCSLGSPTLVRHAAARTDELCSVAQALSSGGQSDTCLAIDHSVGAVNRPVRQQAEWRMPSRTVPVHCRTLQPRWLIEKDGGRFCRLCNQWADSAHLASKKHTKRAETPDWYLEDEDDTGPPLKGSPPPPPGPPAPNASLFAPPWQTHSASDTPGGTKICAWCSNVAMERSVPGTRARYCSDCWVWWMKLGAGAVPAGTRPVPLATGHILQPGAPPPPPQREVGQQSLRWLGGTAAPQRSAPPPPAPFLAPGGLGTDSGRSSLTRRWLDEGGEICV
eukprot:NODE_3877_length_1969_cov_4.617264.p1 GENE.NODE_3877_length_1969_cov_4.617264~~NODE_3877_length_1969_cov_4.617264.p1  ORF type:complete len:416 (-),score=62.80 NODE_3877_length_1969_cov_4.617264:626-1873(-)